MARMPLLWEQQIVASHSEDGLRSLQQGLMAQRAAFVRVGKESSEPKEPSFPTPSSTELLLQIEQIKEEAREIGARIELRMNPTEELHQKVISLLGVMANEAEQLGQSSVEADLLRAGRVIRGARRTLMETAQRILKQEWNRIRDGRP